MWLRCNKQRDKQNTVGGPSAYRYIKTKNIPETEKWVLRRGKSRRRATSQLGKTGPIQILCNYPTEIVPDNPPTRIHRLKVQPVTRGAQVAWAFEPIYTLPRITSMGKANAKVWFDRVRNHLAICASRICLGKEKQTRRYQEDQKFESEKKSVSSEFEIQQTAVKQSRDKHTQGFLWKGWIAWCDWEWPWWWWWWWVWWYRWVWLHAWWGGSGSCGWWNGRGFDVLERHRDNVGIRYWTNLSFSE